MKGDPCKTCGALVDLPAGKLCRKCFYVYQKALPSRQKYYQEKAWKNRPSYQNKTYKNTPSYQKWLQEKAWYTYPKTCEVCGAAYAAPSRISRLCPVCYARQQELKTAPKTAGQYRRIQIDNRQIREHRYLAEQLFGRQLVQDEVNHHLDEDPRHNELGNLLVLSNSNHQRLHRYLEVQQVIEEKQGNPKSWSELISPLSLQWLRDNKIPHLLLSELKAFKDQLLKQSRIANQTNLVQRILEDRIQWRLYPGSFKITAEIPDGLFKANVA